MATGQVNNGTSLQTDSTLAIEGTAADAKATGDALNNKLSLTGGTMSGGLGFAGAITNGSIYTGNDSANAPGGALNNVVIQSWWGVSFTSDCKYGAYGGKNQTAVGIDCREGIVKAARFEGPADNGIATSGADYIRFNDGTQICWGWATPASNISSTDKRVEFPVAFASPARVFTTMNANMGGVPVQVGWEGSTGFTIGCGWNNIGSGGGGTSWFAIGRWK